ncbi:GNAT family N-acetyltransferase [Maribacter sp.]|nr:GNAT family N-acetyltransferase [Maribacter sp.]
MTITLLTADQLTATIQNQVSDLYRQLNADTRQGSLREILQPDNNVTIVVCSMDDVIVGIALLASYKVISGYRGLVEDVVVAATHRGKGIGRKLMEKLLEEAKNKNLDSILLFTGHHRLAAIALYKSLGFTLRKSGIYNLKL